MAIGDPAASISQREATQLQDYDHETPLNPNSLYFDNVVPGQAWLGKRTRPMKMFWRRQVAATVPHEACRDHFGMCSPRCTQLIAFGCRA